MSPRLLYLNNALTEGVPERLDEHFRTLGLDVDVYWAGGGVFPNRLEDYSAVFLSGSPTAPWDALPWMIRESALINAAPPDLPMLGVCFGSQILAHTLCGPKTVFRRPDFETGYVPIATTPAWADDALGQGMPPSFKLFSWHRDEVVGSHEDMVILGSSPSCSNQIWRYRQRPVWGIQGHPEAGGPDAQAWFAANHDDLVRSDAPLADLHRNGFPSTPDAMMLFANFASVALSRI